MKNAFDPSPNDTTKAQIVLLEVKANRAVREAVLNMPGAVARLQAIDTQIAALRAQLTPE